MFLIDVSMKSRRIILFMKKMSAFVRMLSAVHCAAEPQNGMVEEVANSGIGV